MQIRMQFEFGLEGRKGPTSISGRVVAFSKVWRVQGKGLRGRGI